MNPTKKYLVEKTTIEYPTGCEGPFKRSMCWVKIDNLDESLSESKLEELCGYKVAEKVEIQLNLGEGDLSHLFDKLFIRMKLGSKYRYDITFIKKYSIFNPGDKLSFALHLLSYVRNTPIYFMKHEECLEVAEEYKSTGGRLYQKSRYFVAGNFYSKAIKYIIIVSTSTEVSDENAERCEELVATCRLNLAACQLKCDFYTEVITNCTKVLKSNPQTLKALYRRSCAYLALNDIDSARKDVSVGLKINPSSRAMANLSSEIKLKADELASKFEGMLK